MSLDEVRTFKLTCDRCDTATFLYKNIPPSDSDLPEGWTIKRSDFNFFKKIYYCADCTISDTIENT